jgi:phosphoesterase RecJ-like protein
MDDGLPSFLVDIDGVGIAALFKEQTDGSTKVSLRSAAPYDVAAVAVRFGGGGHVRAAGCTLEMGVEEAVRVLIPHLVRQVTGA